MKTTLLLPALVMMLGLPLLAPAQPLVTPSPTLTPTLTPTPVAKVFSSAPEFVTLEVTEPGGPLGRTFVAFHNGLVPEGSTKHAVGFWVRLTQPTLGPWRYLGLRTMQPGSGSTSIPFDPGTETGTFQLAARFRFDNQWFGDTFYGIWTDPAAAPPTPTPTPAPPPEIVDLFVEGEAPNLQLAAETNGFVSWPATQNRVGFWTRSFSPRGPWTFHGFQSYVSGQTVTRMPWEQDIQAGVTYEVSARLRGATAWIGAPFNITYRKQLPTPPPITYTAYHRGGNPLGYTPIGAPNGSIYPSASRFTGRFYSFRPDRGKSDTNPTTLTVTLIRDPNSTDDTVSSTIWRIDTGSSDWDYLDYRIKLVDADFPAGNYDSIFGWVTQWTTDPELAPENWTSPSGWYDFRRRITDGYISGDGLTTTYWVRAAESTTYGD
jgi:hypothetical protein